jgi:hypothetical protein
MKTFDRVYDDALNTGRNEIKKIILQKLKEKIKFYDTLRKKYKNRARHYDSKDEGMFQKQFMIYDCKHSALVDLKKELKL